VKVLDRAVLGLLCEVSDGKLSLKLPGPPEARHGGRSVRFHARKAVALLAYLAAEGGRHRRGEIIELLWPGRDEAHGRAVLKSALSSLRKALGESAEPSEKPHLLGKRGKGVFR
jgi:DNA-binding SARP family transcriptional activator